MKLNRLIYLFISLILIFALLSACSNKVAQYDGNTALPKEKIYLKKNIALPEEHLRISAIAADDEHLYIKGAPLMQTDTPHTGIYVLDKAGNYLNLISIPLYTDDSEIKRNIMSFCADRHGNIWLLGYLYEKGSQNIISYFAESCSVDGNSVQQIKIGSGPEKFIRIYADNDYLYITGVDGLDVFEKNGGHLMQSRNIPHISDLIFFKGSPYIAYERFGKMVLQRIDVSAKQLAEVIETNAEKARFYSGDIYDYYYSYNSGLYGVNIESGKAELLCDFINFSFAGHFSGIIPCSDGSFLICTSQDVCRLYPSDKPENEPVTLTLGTTDPRFLSEMVEKFNSSNKECQIKIIDYSRFNLSPSSGEGIMKLNTEIISGSGPDIFDLSSLPASVYEKAGALADIYPFIKKDPETKGIKFSPIISKMETNGKLFSLIPKYMLITIVGSEPDVEDSKLTFDKLLELRAGISPEATILGKSVSKKDFLNIIMSMSDNIFIDYEKMKCKFNSKEFKDMLLFIATLPDNSEEVFDPRDIYSRKQLLSLCSFGGNTMLFVNDVIFNGKMSFAGIPAKEDAGAVVCPFLRLGISENCTRKDFAWAFLRMFIKDEYQLNGVGGFPLTMKAIEKAGEELKSRAAKGNNRINVTDETGKDLALELDVVRTVELMDRLFSTVKCVYNENYELCEIIWEDMQAYLNGDKSLDETAELIQSKVGIYLSEQYG